ncbi:MAG: carboxynorspermidine decarboxylase [Lachnospiraceae bacterium]|nr:carboxynorspermidine decarboxylase [Lachnospiraceae bacterium]
MRGNDSRPPFGALDGRTPGELFGSLPTPCYVIEEKKLEENAKLLASLTEETGCKILLAQKAFSNYDFYPLLSSCLAGTEASGLFEARLGAEEMPDGEVHVFCAAYREEEMDELLRYADHVVFNSPGQLRRFGPMAKAAGRQVGLRINPQCSTQEGHAIYDPCAQGSRLGTTLQVWKEQMSEELVELLDGLHFHTLCEQDADALETTLAAVEESFGAFLSRMKWLNMGGGHHITKPGYDLEKLKKCIKYAQDKWKLQVYLEPGEAVALNSGYLVTRILDIVENSGVRIAIIDASAACHMPDVIEMPYTPPLYGALPWEEKEETAPFAIQEKNGAVYRLAGPTCLAGDVVGDYLFPGELQIGDLLVFGDMAIYTTCKNNTFNGMPLPDLWRRTPEGEAVRLTAFGYEAFKGRLGSRQ